MRSMNPIRLAAVTLLATLATSASADVDGRVAIDKHIGPMTPDFVQDKLLPMIETLRKPTPLSPR